ncbi:MAG: hypothetical protein P4L59_21210 [Desulfosporosinus sp.]|nr:hypothetical protein [Desulfosporosinus sp.]
MANSAGRVSDLNNYVFLYDRSLLGVKMIQGSVIHLNNSQQTDAKLILESAINTENGTGDISLKISEIQVGDTEAHMLLNKFLYVAQVEKVEFALKSLETGLDLFVANKWTVNVGDIELLGTQLSQSESLLRALVLKEKALH